MSFLESCFRFDKVRKEEDRLATKEKCASLDEDASKMDFPKNKDIDFVCDKMVEIIPYGNSTVIAYF